MNGVADTSAAKTILVEVQGREVAICTFPVTRDEYLEFARASGRAMPPSVSRGRRGCAAMTDVTHAEALEYCRWRGTVEGPPYRLPSTADLTALYRTAGDNTQMPLVWAQAGRPCPEEESIVAAEEYLCEWAAETETVVHASGARTLGTIFYPPWHSEDAYRSRARAAVDATKGYAFVSFRLAYDVRQA